MSGLQNASIGQFVSQDTDEWATPPTFARPLANAVGGFDLDPASGAEHSPIAEQTYTEEDDGLVSSWFGQIWCNPPYSEIEDWARRSVDQSKRDDVDLILLLCKGDSSADWWQYAVKEAEILALIDGRLSFGRSDGDAPFPSHVVGFGEIPVAAKDVLAGRGVVVDLDHLHEKSEQRRVA